MNYIIGGVALAVGSLYLWFIQDIRVPNFGGPVNGRVFPLLVGVAFVLVALTFFFPSSRKTAGEAPQPNEAPLLAEANEEEAESPMNYPVFAGILIGTLIYYLAFEPIGYILSTVVYLGGMLAYFHPGRHKTNAAIAILFPVLTYGLFSKLLGLALPLGLLKLG